MNSWQIPDNILHTLNDETILFLGIRKIQRITRSKPLEAVSYHFAILGNPVIIYGEPSVFNKFVLKPLVELIDKSIYPIVNELLSFLTQQYVSYLESQPTLRLRYTTGDFVIETQYLEGDEKHDVTTNSVERF